MRYLIIFYCVFVSACSATDDGGEIYLRDWSYRCSTVDDCAERITKSVTKEFRKAQIACQQDSPPNSATIRILIDREGNLESSELVTSSGDLRFDEIALKAINKTAPFFEVREVNAEVFEEVKEILFTFVCDKPLSYVNE